MNQEDPLGSKKPSSPLLISVANNSKGIETTQSPEAGKCIRNTAPACGLSYDQSSLTAGKKNGSCVK